MNCADDVEKMVPTVLFNTELPQTFQFVKNTVSAKCSELKHSKMRYDCMVQFHLYEMSSLGRSMLLLLLSHVQLLQPCGLQPTRLLCPWDSSGKNTTVGCHFLLQGIFLIQGSSLSLLHLLHSRWILLPLLD